MPRWPPKPQHGHIVPGIDAEADAALLQMSGEATTLALSLAGIPARHRDALSDVTLALARACYLAGMRDVPDTIFTLRQVAAQLGLHPQTVRHRATERGLGTLLNATTRMYTQEDIDNLRTTYRWGERSGYVRKADRSQPADEWVKYRAECAERAAEHKAVLRARYEKRLTKVRLQSNAELAARAARELKE